MQAHNAMRDRLTVEACVTAVCLESVARNSSANFFMNRE
jgi:hypothetical protein